MNSVEVECRLRRLSKMSPSEVRWRISDQMRRKRWASRQILPQFAPDSWSRHLSAGQAAPWDSARDWTFRPFASEELQAVPDEARQRVIAAADGILAGQWQLLGVVRRDMED